MLLEGQLASGERENDSIRILTITAEKFRLLFAKLVRAVSPSSCRKTDFSRIGIRLGEVGYCDLLARLQAERKEFFSSRTRQIS